MSSSSAHPESGTTQNAGPAPETAADVGLVPMLRIEGEWTVDKVIATIPGGPPEQGTTSPLPYFHLLERLKTTKREGWRRFGIKRGESIADHMYRMALMSMAAPPSLIAKNLNLDRCIKMCLIHDMAESIVGDIMPVDNVSKPEKNRREAETMDYITKNLLGNLYGGGASPSASDNTGAEIRAIWQEYEDSETLESKYVHDIDKMELLLQMIEYEKRGEGKLDLGEFAYVATKMVLPETKLWADELLADRRKFWGERKHVDGVAGTAGGVTVEQKLKSDIYYRGSGAPRDV